MKMFKTLMLLTFLGGLLFSTLENAKAADVRTDQKTEFVCTPTVANELTPVNDVILYVNSYGDVTIYETGLLTTFTVKDAELHNYRWSTRQTLLTKNIKAKSTFNIQSRLKEHRLCSWQNKRC